MAVSRREATLGIVLALTAACSTGATGKAEPASGWWRQYRSRFLDPSGRIIDTGNGGISHSEGQGYGMVLAYLANDQDAFAAMAKWADAHLAQAETGLYAWRFDPRSPNPVSDPNNATDGDILIAWALALAGRKWRVSAYAEGSTALRAAIRRTCVVERFGRTLLLPGRVGFVSPADVTVNPAYYVWPALDLFARLDGQAVWQDVIAGGEDILLQSKFGPLRLPTDWVAVTASGLAPARDKPPRFGFDAVRVPLYAVLGRRAAQANDIGAWWRSVMAQQRLVPAWIDVVTGEQAPYPLSSGGMAVVARTTGAPAPTQLDNDYYSASLQLLAAARF